MEEQPVAPPAPPASLREFRDRKAAAAPGFSPTPPVEKPAPAVPQGENAGASAPPKQETQEPNRHPKKAQSAEDRAAELRAAGRVKEADKILADDAEKKEFDSWKAGKADREREAEELRQLRARPAAAAPAPPDPQPKPAAPGPVSDKPRLKDFLAKPENASKTHDEIVDLWSDAVDVWQEAQSRTQTLNRSVAEKEDAARQAHPDYDQYMKGQNFIDTIAKLNPRAIATAAIKLPNGTEALYRLAKDRNEIARIASLDPDEQVIELGVMSRAIASEGQPTPKPPEKTPTPPVSRTPPPIRQIGGIAPAEKETTGPPSSLRDHRERKLTRAS